jgi:gliding motility-associated-like protein
MRKQLAILFFFLISANAFATHQRAGEITYKYLGNLTYEFTIITYTYTPSLADRPQLVVDWGDGTTSVVDRTNEIYYPNDIKYNEYKTTHAYSAPATYTISMEDPNRNYGVLNIPNSVNVPFYIETELVVNPFLGPNNSPILLNPPIDNGCTGVPFIHNPGAYDIDGDSLSYRLVNCKGEQGLDILGYSLPPASNSISIDPTTGTFIWDSPTIQGEVNVAILIEEWRHGIKIGSVLRDMQITIQACNNNPPEILNYVDTCVEVGNTLSYQITATDINNDDVTLSASGGPFQLPNNPATFPSNTANTTVSSTLTWTPLCEHVRLSPYQIYIRAEDDSYPVNLIDLKIMNIRVVAPAPENLTVTPQGSSMLLSWDPYICQEAEYIEIYRKNMYYGFIPAECETGVPAYTGYSKIGQTNNITTTSFVDNNNGQGMIPGLDYCYMIIAVFPDGAESYATPEVCQMLKKDLPVITNVSVRNTDFTDGANYIAWSKASEIDTNLYKGPFRYLIYRSTNISGSAMQLIDSTLSENDTTYIDTLLNTESTANSYYLELYDLYAGSRTLVGESVRASSVFLSIIPTDKKLILSWNEIVPWLNSSYVVYKYNPISLTYDSIATTTDSFYVDSGLVNGVEYCYKIKSIGAYSGSGFINPIINYSQEACESPIDNVPPCPPELSVDTDCELVQNTLDWFYDDISCALDVKEFHIYYQAEINQDYTLLTIITNPQDRSYIHQLQQTIAACYYIVAVDSAGNQSEASNTVCVDIDVCDPYRLPNVFTPNGDGVNDYFHPFPYDLVREIDLHIYNRWGALVFSTKDPDIMWDGINQMTNRMSADGVYYYVCDVYEIGFEGLRKRTLTGIVTILSGNN